MHTTKGLKSNFSTHDKLGCAYVKPINAINLPVRRITVCSDWKWLEGYVLILPLQPFPLSPSWKNTMYEYKMGTTNTNKNLFKKKKDLMSLQSCLLVHLLKVRNLSVGRVKVCSDWMWPLICKVTGRICDVFHFCLGNPPNFFEKYNVWSWSGKLPIQTKNPTFLKFDLSSRLSPCALLHSF